MPREDTCLKWFCRDLGSPNASWGHPEQSSQSCSQLTCMLLAAAPVTKELEKGTSGVWQQLPSILDLSLQAQSPK